MLIINTEAFIRLNTCFKVWKGIKKGTAKITVTCNGVSKTFKVTVK